MSAEVCELTGVSQQPTAVNITLVSPLKANRESRRRELGVSYLWRRLFVSWLRQREAKVIVGGAFSKPMSLKDMVYQGTVSMPLQLS